MLKSQYKIFVIYPSSALIFLWIYASVSKLIAFGEFKDQMSIQIFGREAALYLVYILPGTELLAGILLAFEKSRLQGFHLSFMLLSVMTGYIVLIMLNVFGNTPCSCGGILGQMGWKVHLLFNIFFLTITLIAIIYQRKENSDKQKV